MGLRNRTETETRPVLNWFTEFSDGKLTGLNVATVDSQDNNTDRYSIRGVASFIPMKDVQWHLKQKAIN